MKWNEYLNKVLNTFLGDYMFYHCVGLVTVDVTNGGQNSLERIGYAAFGERTSLTNLTDVEDFLPYFCFGLYFK